MIFLSTTVISIGLLVLLQGCQEESSKNNDSVTNNESSGSRPTSSLKSSSSNRNALTLNSDVSQVGSIDDDDEQGLNLALESGLSNKKPRHREGLVGSMKFGSGFIADQKAVLPHLRTQNLGSSMLQLATGYSAAEVKADPKAILDEAAGIVNEMASGNQQISPSTMGQISYMELPPAPSSVVEVHSRVATSSSPHREGTIQSRTFIGKPVSVVSTSNNFERIRNKDGKDITLSALQRESTGVSYQQSADKLNREDSQIKIDKRPPSKQLKGESSGAQSGVLQDVHSKANLHRHGHRHRHSSLTQKRDIYYHGPRMFHKSDIDGAWPEMIRQIPVSKRSEMKKFWNEGGREAVSVMAELMNEGQLLNRDS